MWQNIHKALLLCAKVQCLSWGKALMWFFELWCELAGQTFQSIENDKLFTHSGNTSWAQCSSWSRLEVGGDTLCCPAAPLRMAAPHQPQETQVTEWRETTPEWSSAVLPQTSKQKMEMRLTENDVSKNKTKKRKEKKSKISGDSLL